MFPVLVKGKDISEYVKRLRGFGFVELHENVYFEGNVHFRNVGIYGINKDLFINYQSKQFKYIYNR